MRKLLAVAGLSLLKTWKDKLFVIIMIATALVFTSVSFLFFGGGTSSVLMPVSITDYDRSELVRKMTDDLKAAGSYSITMRTEDQMYQDVRQGNAETGFLFPAGFEASVKAGEPLDVGVVSLSTSKTSMAAVTIVEKSLTRYMLDRAVRTVAIAKAEELGLAADVDAGFAAKRAEEILSKTPALTVEFEQVKLKSAANTVTWAAGYSIGLYIMFTMFTVLFQAGDILQERKEGTWGRLLTAPVSRAAIMGGKILGAYAVGLVQIVVLFLSARYLFRINFGDNVAGVLAVLGLMVLVVTGLGLLLSTLVRTTAQLQAAVPIIIVSTCMLGGCYWPIDVVSPLMQTIGKFTPQAWAMVALSDIVLRGRTLASTWVNILVLAGFGVLFFAFGAARVKYE
jgi:ABC-2 type transport system permease protein